MSSSVEEQNQVEVVPKPETPICCKECGSVVVNRKGLGAAKVGGEHTFRNPAGYSFHVVVFPEASGCVLVGEAVSQDSWFPPHSWRIALCSECHSHLGWGFESSGEPGFVGLIATRLTGLK